MKKTVKSLAIAFCVGLFLCALSGQADQLDRKTIFTFSAPVRVGETTLPAGTYTFKLMDLGADRNVVQIFDADDMHLITTIMAIPDYRVEPTGHTVVKFAETNDGSQLSGNIPDTGIPIKEWFYPGDNFGQEFKIVPAEVAAVQPEPSPGPAPESSPAPPTAAAPEPAPAPVTAAPAPEEPPAQEAAPAPSAPTGQSSPSEDQSAPKELPQTASQLPLVGLVGILCLAAAASLRIFLKLSA
jgi:hypothetical protein